MSSHQDDLVLQMVDVTGADPPTALQYLMVKKN